jgi:Flp pilus assembly protein TadG
MTQTNVSKCAGGTSRRRVPRRERGQILYMTALVMTTIFGFCGFVIDSGRMYLNYQELQASTDSAALAGGWGLPSGTTAIANANQFSSLTNDNNAEGNLKSVAMVTGYPAVKCISYTYVQIPCAGANGTYNVIQVKQQAVVNMTLAQFFGAKSVTIQATATASSKGSVAKPYNIAVILDQTASMSQSNSDSCTDPYNSNKPYTTRNACSLVGLKTLLLNTAPCTGNYTGASGTGNCPTNGTSAVDMISVFVFPNFEYNTGANAYTGTCSAFTHASNYTFPYMGTSYTTYPYPSTPAL